MIGDLSLTLKALLQAQERPEVVREAEVAFDPPGESYPPSLATINTGEEGLEEDQRPEHSENLDHEVCARGPLGR